MEFVSDPPIAVKIQKMQQRVRWQHEAILERGIDQTALALDDGQTDDPEFSFLVIGDSGSGAHRNHSPQRKIAEQMLEHQDCRFVLHTGDVIYLVGSSDYYLKNFIDPYREFLVGGERPKRIKFDQIKFKLPFMLVPGNHDYYDLPLFYGALMRTTAPIRYLLRSQLDFDVGWRGSQQGKAYAQAFLDYLISLENPALAQHLDRYYTAQSEAGRCLRYRPQEFTRLPNRYYQFRYGGIDFFALDSNTFNAPLPLSNDAEGKARRKLLEQRRSDVQREQQELFQTSTTLNPNNLRESEQLDDIRAKIEQLEEVEKDINKQLRAEHGNAEAVDAEQLNWLKQRLIESWHTDAVRGRVIFFHHPPYVTEATKWHQGQTLAVRERLRSVLDSVMAEVGEKQQNRPIVDLVLNGHAHCLEYLRTGNTGHGDANINWIVCGGSGYSLRRQRQEGPELLDDDFGTNLSLDAKTSADLNTGTYVAKSHLFVGRTGQGHHKRRPYSFLRIDVQDGSPPRFVVRPYIAERYQGSWYEQSLTPLIL